MAVGGGQSKNGKKSDTDQAVWGGVIAFNTQNAKEKAKKYTVYNVEGNVFKPSGIEYDADRDIFYLKKGSTIYIATEDIENSTLRAISSIKINNGDCKNWTYQGGLSYKNDTIYVPIWNEKNQKPIQF